MTRKRRARVLGFWMPPTVVPPSVLSSALMSFCGVIFRYAEMGRKEVMNFRMVRDSKAPTEYGRPLHFTCFSSLQLCLVQGKNVGGHDIKLSDLNPFAVADLVKIEDSEPLGKMWTHRSPPGIKTREPFWDDHVLWSDIKLPFEQVSGNDALRLNAVIVNHANPSQKNSFFCACASSTRT